MNDDEPKVPVSFKIEVIPWNDPFTMRKELRRPNPEDVEAYGAWADSPLIANRRRVAQFLHAEFGGICDICEEPIDISLTDPHHPRTAQIDHIIPTSKGGANVWGNVRVVHRICNMRRNDERDPLSVKDAKKSLVEYTYEYEHPEIFLPERLLEARKALAYGEGVVAELESLGVYDRPGREVARASDLKKLNYWRRQVSHMEARLVAAETPPDTDSAD